MVSAPRRVIRGEKGFESCRGWKDKLSHGTMTKGMTSSQNSQVIFDIRFESPHLGLSRKEPILNIHKGHVKNI
jgi:hypothetical protein